MAAFATQRVPQEKKGAPQKGVRPTPEKKGFKEMLYDLSQTAGIVLMAAMLVLSLFVGNMRALQNATPKDFIRQGDVESIVEDRIDAAGNALTVARRAGLDETVYAAVQSACDEMSTVKTARDISRADQWLTTAVTDMTVQAAVKLGDEDRTMLQSAVDDFTEQGSFLRQEARSYNEAVKKAEELYEKLPTKFLLAEPDVYEGV